MLRYLLAKTRPPLPHSVTSHVQTRALSSITGTGFRPSNPLTHSHTHSHTHSNKGEAFYHITNTINNFLLCMDYNKSDEFARLFTHSATCEVVKSAALVTGRDSLKLLCENLHSRFSPALHMESNVNINIKNECEATSMSYWMAVLGGDIVSTGSHEDTLVRDEHSGLWLFQKRIIRHHWTKDGGFEKKSSE